MRRTRSRKSSRRKREDGLTTVETLIVQAGVAAVIFALVAVMVRFGWLEDIIAALSDGPRSAGEFMEMVRAFWE